MKIAFRTIFRNPNHFDLDRQLYTKLTEIFEDWLDEKLGIVAECDYHPIGTGFRFKEDEYLWLQFTTKHINQIEKKDFVVYWGWCPLDMDIYNDNFSGFCITKFWGHDFECIYVSRGFYSSNGLTEAMKKSWIDWITHVTSHEFLHYFKRNIEEVDKNYNKTERYKGYLMQVTEL